MVDERCINPIQNISSADRMHSGGNGSLKAEAFGLAQYCYFYCYLRIYASTVHAWVRSEEWGVMTGEWWAKYLIKNQIFGNLLQIFWKIVKCIIRFQNKTNTFFLQRNYGIFCSATRNLELIGVPPVISRSQALSKPSFCTTSSRTSTWR